MIPTHEQRNIFYEILQERKNQDMKWGTQDHDPFTWNGILIEEIGEGMKEVLSATCATTNNQRYRLLQNYRKELIQVAAVALAMIESHDRWSEGHTP